MQLAYGGYFFPVSMCDLKAHSITRRNKGGQPYSVVQSIDVDGFLVGNGQSEITTLMGELITVLQVNYKDLIFHQDDGARSATMLLNAGSISGVTITKGPEFVHNDGSEYTTRRRFSFTAEAEYPLPGTQNLLLNFVERLRFRGGGPIYGHKLAINGVPQKQLLYPASIYRVTQTGESVGYLKTPAKPPPLWPNDLRELPGEEEDTSPGLKGKGYEGFPISWRYEFESAKPLVGTPHLWVF